MCSLYVQPLFNSETVKVTVALLVLQQATLANSAFIDSEIIFQR